MRFEVAPLTASEVRLATDVLVEAFWDYPESVHLFPSARARKFGLSRFMRQTIVEALPAGEVLATRVNSRITGVAVWKPPERAQRTPLARLRQGLSLAPVGIIAPGAAREAIACSNEMRRRHPCAPHHYLAAIGVRPAFARKGVGVALLEPILRRADDEDTGCYLSTATAENAAWYQRHGFVLVAKFKPTRGWPTVWALWRSALNDRRHR